MQMNVVLVTYHLFQSDVQQLKWTMICNKIFRVFRCSFEQKRTVCPIDNNTKINCTGYTPAVKFIYTLTYYRVIWVFEICFSVFPSVAHFCLGANYTIWWFWLFPTVSLFFYTFSYLVLLFIYFCCAWAFSVPFLKCLPIDRNIYFYAICFHLLVIFVQFTPSCRSIHFILLQSSQNKVPFLLFAVQRSQIVFLWGEMNEYERKKCHLTFFALHSNNFPYNNQVQCHNTIDNIEDCSVLTEHFSLCFARWHKITRN